MTTRRVVGAVGAALLVGVLTGGCRADAAGPASTVAPLSSIDSTLDAIERDLDADSG